MAQNSNIQAQCHRLRAAQCSEGVRCIYKCTVVLHVACLFARLTLHVNHFDCQLDERTLKFGSKCTSLGALNCIIASLLQ
jgi:hypothetical protein